MFRNRVFHRSVLSIAIAAALPMVACAAENEPDDAFDQVRLEGEASGEAIAAELPPEQAARAGVVVSIVSALVESEIELSAAASLRATDSAVRGFADRMVRAHLAASSNLDRLIQALDLQPVPTVISQQVRLETTSDIIELLTMPVGDVDLWYMRKQIYMHARARLLISGISIRVQSEALRNHLNELVGKIDQSLFEALDIARRLVDAQRPEPTPQP